jgi:hypothetical protein
MTAVSLFPFAEYWWFYGAFTLFVLGLLALDLGVSGCTMVNACLQSSQCDQKTKAILPASVSRPGFTLCS